MSWKTWIAATLVIPMGMPMLMALGGCFYDHHDDRAQQDRPSDSRAQNDNDHHDDHLDADHPDADDHMDK